MSSLILKMFGWNEEIRASNDELLTLDETTVTKDKCVVLLSHTSSVEFLLFMLYSNIYPNLANEFRTMVTERNFVFGLHFLLRSYNCIPVPKACNSNTVKRVCDQLKEDPSIRGLIMSPKGKLARSPWKSGFYHIAKEMGWKVRVCGFDFERRCFAFGPVRDLASTYEKTKSILEKDMGFIVPGVAKQF